MAACRPCIPGFRHNCLLKLSTQLFAFANNLLFVRFLKGNALRKQSSVFAFS